MREAQPYDRDAYHRMANSLLQLVVAGHRSKSIADEPWLTDDRTDLGTQADIEHATAAG